MDRISKSFFTGINYWGSKESINMWQNFDEESIENDFKLLSAAGITHLRVFPLWSVFQPLHALYGPKDIYEYSFGEEPLPDTEAGRAGVSEETCKKFEVFCSIAEKYGMKLIVALITGHMSFRTYNPPAFDGKALLSDPTVIKWQRRFVKYFVTRFKTENSIVAWDLGNEPIHLPGMEGLSYDAFYVWCSMIADTIRICDQERPVVSGLDEWVIENGYSNLKTIGEICDINTTHPYNIFVTEADPLPTMKPTLDLAFKCRLGEDISGIPTFVQEFSSLGYMNCSQKTEADFYRACLLTCLAHNCKGTMWWCAFDQGQHKYAPYRWNNIGSDYGFFNKELEEKPLAKVNRSFKELLKKLPEGNLPPYSVNATVLVPRDDGGAELDNLRSVFMLAKQANFDVNFSYTLDPIPDSPLYILPSVSSSKTITKQRLDELLEKVENGAVLYISADTGLFRMIPEITGVSIAYRERIDAKKTVNFAENTFEIGTTYFLKPESCNGEILATDENGEGVFFKHKMGKGYVYFLTVPLEKHLALEKGVFFKDKVPPYDIFYRTLAEQAGINRIADSDNPFIRLTEHKIDENNFYVFAINYNNKPANATISFSEAFEIETVFGNSISNGVLSLDNNDGALFKVCRKQG